MSLITALGFAFQFLAGLLKLKDESDATKAKAQAATDAAISHLHQVGDPS